MKAAVINDRDGATLTQRGYEILDRLGEGNTREAFLARYKSGDVAKLRVLTIAKSEVDPDSITTLVNTSKRDVDAREITVSNTIQHPYLAEVVDAFQLEDGRRVNVEAYHEGTDLETLVTTAGPLDSQKVEKVASQLTEALAYLHGEAGLVHRDIKPSNILMTPAGDIILRDLQNTASIKSLEEKTMPTRGGSQYTHPALLNALVNQSEAKASEKTDIYALGATIHFLLTGDDAFDYQTVASDKGTEVEIDGTFYKVKLEGIGSDTISREEHFKNQKKAFRKVPRKWRRLLKKATSLDDANLATTRDLKSELDRLSLQSRIKSGAKYAIPAAAVSLVAGAALIWGVHEANVEPRPKISELLTQEQYEEWSLSGMEKGALYSFVPELADAGFLLNNNDPFLDERVSSRVERASHLRGMDKRLTSALIRTCYLYGEDMAEEYESRRVGSIFVPTAFVDKTNKSQGKMPLPQGNIDEDLFISEGIAYLQQCIGKSSNVADAFTHYFSTLPDIMGAKAVTRNSSYFSSDGPAMPHKVGYSASLPESHRKFIDTAVGLYLVTDNEGKIDASKIPHEYNVRWVGAPQGMGPVKRKTPKSGELAR